MSPHSTTTVPSGSAWKQIRAIPLSYNRNEPETSARRLSFALFPDWETEEGDVEFIPLKDGITNTLMRAVKRRPTYSAEDNDRESVLIRVYGEETELLINRDREITCHSILARRGLAPPLLARFDNGLIYEFIQGHVCSPEDLTKEVVWRAVACRLAQWHALLPIVFSKDTAMIKDGTEIPLSSSPPKTKQEKEALAAITPDKPPPTIWTVMLQWIFNLPARTTEEINRRDLLQKELTWAAKELRDTPGLGAGLVLGHCDLLSGNVIVEPCKPSSLPSSPTANGPNRESVSFIDYEYATPSPAAFDLANHFSEWIGFECNYDNIPTRETRRAFIQEYVQNYSRYATLGDNFTSDSSDFNDSDAGTHTHSQTQDFYVRRLLDEVDRFRGIPGLYWGIWSLIQATISRKDFDYASYADVRLVEYFDWRAEVEGRREGEVSKRERRWMG